MDTSAKQKNVLGLPLEPCGSKPMTGFYRDGCCNTGPEDRGVHTICCIVDAPLSRRLQGPRQRPHHPAP